MLDASTLLDQKVIGGPQPSDLYVASLYFTMTTLTSVGYGNIAANTVAEQSFCAVVLIFGGECVICSKNNAENRSRSASGRMTLMSMS